VAQGIKAFKKGMSEDEANVEPVKPEPVKTIDHQSAQTVGQTENSKTG
ncbi:MAG: twin-arginine translocase TatA/TatE family subunit, partial [Rhodoplanes sp.]